METLVAVNAPPRKSALFQGRPRACAAPAPRKNGQMTPDKSHQECSDARLAHAFDIGFQAGDEHQNQAADLRHHQERLCGLSSLKKADVHEVECAWTGNNTNQKFP